MNDRYEFLKLKITGLLAIVNELSVAFESENRKFTLDGRLVGDIGEIIAHLHYDIVLDERSEANYDATHRDRRVQIKVTMQDQLTFKNAEGYYLGLKIYPAGSFKEIYNGPAMNIYDRFRDRKGIGKTLLRSRNALLEEISGRVPDEERISLREQIVPSTEP